MEGPNQPRIVMVKVEDDLTPIDIDDLTPLQGELKTLSDENFNKLRNSILKKGFKLAIHVWQNGGVNYLIDGHQRVHVLKQMRKEGIEIPPVPCVLIQASTYHDAKETVLLAVSQHGKLDKQGFDEFVEGEDFEFDDLDFPDVADDFFDNSDFNYSEKLETKIKEAEIVSTSEDIEKIIPNIEGAKELSENDFDDFDHQCPKCGFCFDSKK